MKPIKLRSSICARVLGYFADQYRVGLMRFRIWLAYFIERT